MQYKGIILAGGSGTRLRPITDLICKQLLPVHDKPLIYYPLTSMILAGIRDILIISTPRDTPILKAAIGNGKTLGISIQYKVQEEPKGLAEAFIIGEDYLNGSPVCMMLGDNILYKSGFSDFIQKSLQENKGATVFGIPVNNPNRFGIIEIDKKTNNIISIEEKPKAPKSNLAAIGLYVYDNTVSQKARKLKPSSRNELEITDLNNIYLKEKSLNFARLSRGDLWMDVGVFNAFNDASQLIRLIEARMGLKIGCPEEASHVMENISDEELKTLALTYQSSPYGEYLTKIVEHG